MSILKGKIKTETGDTLYPETSTDKVVGLGAQIILLQDNGSTTAGTWKAKTDKISAYADGQIFLYKIVVAGSTTTTLNITGSGGTALGAKTIYRVGTTKLTTQYGVGQYIMLIYNRLNTCFRVITDSDSDTNTKVRQYQAGTAGDGTTNKYPILTRYALTDKNGTYDANYARYHTGVTIDTSDGTLDAPAITVNGSAVARLQDVAPIGTAITSLIYNLGKYDYQSGNTVRRQTGYVAINSEPNLEVASLSAYSGACTQMVITNPLFTTDVEFVSNVLNRSTSWEATLNNAKANNGQLFFNIPLQSSTGDAIAYTKSLNIVIQVQLASYFDEKVIEDQNINTLDLTGTQFVRDEWEKAQNLAQYYVSTNVNDRVGYRVATALPAGTYTLEIYNNGNANTYLWTSQHSGVQLTNNKQITFTLTATSDVEVNVSDGSGTTTGCYFMLVEGDYAYPYKPYNGPLVHQKDCDKNRYNLGVYDRVSGNTITRQTGYITINAENIVARVQGTNSAGCSAFSTDIALAYSANWGEIVGTSNLGYPVTIVDSYWIGENTIGFYQNTLFISQQSEAPIEQIRAKCPIVIQYKLATPYTETINPGQSLITLDQNGSEWLRKEWEKGLNLLKLNPYDFRGTAYNGGIGLSDQKISIPSGLGINWYGVFFKITLPAGTYTMRLLSSVTSGHVGRIQVNDSDSGPDLGTLYVDKSIAGATGLFGEDSTFTLTQTKTLYGRFCMDVDYIGNSMSGGSTSIAHTFNIMLVKGSRAYPYQPYSGALVHKSETEGTLLWENANPSGFANNIGSPISIGRSGYKYLVFAYILAGSTPGIYYTKIGNSDAFYASLSIMATNGDRYTRMANVTSSGVEFTNSYLNGTDCQALYCVPVAIYGTNTL